MFTGLIEEIGAILVVERVNRERRLWIDCGFDLGAVEVGDSIAVDGVCLTVVEKSNGRFAVQVSEESLQLTALAEKIAGTAVNLERALVWGGRLDGHLVQGHVDTVGRVERMSPRGPSIEIWFRVPDAAGRYIVPKGSIAVNGVSLTVNEVADAGGETRFSVNIIPHTRGKTNLADLAPGGAVNIETDLLGRYVERLLERGLGRGSGRKPKLDAAYLQERGF